MPGVGSDPTSPRLQRGAFTRLASQAELRVVRPTGIEPMSARWHRAALPLSYGRRCEIVAGGSAPLPTET